MCNCEYCIRCDNCGHKADEHIAGDGECFRCKCSRFTSRISDAWDKLSIAEQSATSFQEFANSLASH